MWRSRRRPSAARRTPCATPASWQPVRGSWQPKTVDLVPETVRHNGPSRPPSTPTSSPSPFRTHHCPLSSTDWLPPRRTPRRTPARHREAGHRGETQLGPVVAIVAIVTGRTQRSMIALFATASDCPPLTHACLLPLARMRPHPRPNSNTPVKQQQLQQRVPCRGVPLSARRRLASMMATRQHHVLLGLPCAPAPPTPPLKRLHTDQHSP